jgi:hypothetical protein
MFVTGTRVEGIVRDTPAADLQAKKEGHEKSRALIGVKVI